MMRTSSGWNRDFCNSRDCSVAFRDLENKILVCYVYYGCAKAKNCKCGYISEEDLIKQLQRKIDKLDFKKMPIQEKIQIKIKRFKKFQMMATGKNENIDVNDVDVKNYIKFLLK